MATSSIKNLGLSKASTNLLPTVRAVYTSISSDGGILHEVDNVNKNIISLQIKTSAAITSGSVQLSGLPFPTHNLWGALASSDGHTGWVQISSDGKLYIRCEASSTAYMCGQVVY